MWGNSRPEAVEDRRLGKRDRVAGAGLGQAPAVEDDQRQRGDRQRVGQAGGLDDRGEFARVEAGPADQRPVDVGLGHQLGGVVGLDRAAVEDADPLGRGAERPAASRG